MARNGTPPSPMTPRGRRETTYDVRVFGIRPVHGKRATTYECRWQVRGRQRSRSFATKALAESHRAGVLSAARRGDAFDVETGLPVSMLPDERQVTWWEWALTYVDTRWRDLAPLSRRSTAEALTTATMAMLTTDRGRPPAKSLRSAMMQWAFNAGHRAQGDLPVELTAAVSWLETHTVPLTALDDTARMRSVLDALALKLDGTTAAATTIARKRAVIHNVLELAVERELFPANPMSRVRWKRPKVPARIDVRVVANPEQALRLLDGVRSQEKGRPLVAFFASMYYSALRPGEAVELRVQNLDLPESGWGWLHITSNNPEGTAAWSDSGKRRGRRLKHRAEGEVRTVPCPPQLTQLLHEHLDTHGTTPGGRLFRGPLGGQITAKQHNEIWAEARTRALTLAEAASPLARRPYDLRHACVSTWLAAGVDPAQIAEWAGHSVNVLLRVYAKSLKGREEATKAMIMAVLGD